MDDYLGIKQHDAFRNGGGLNKSAGEVYFELLQCSLTAKELMQRTGRCRSTIFICLQRMANVVDSSSGEVISMVESKNGVWRLLPDIDLNYIALLLGTAGTGKRKREQHIKEQRKHKRDLQRNI